MKKKDLIMNFMIDIANTYEFRIYIDDWSDRSNELFGENYSWLKVFKLEDYQSWNLWWIENDEFLNLSEVLDRLEVYYNDYILEDLLDQWITWDSYEDLMKIRKKGYDYELTICKFTWSDNITNELKKIEPKDFENFEYDPKYDYKKIKRYFEKYNS